MFTVFAVWWVEWTRISFERPMHDSPCQLVCQPLRHIADLELTEGLFDLLDTFDLDHILVLPLWGREVSPHTLSKHTPIELSKWRFDRMLSFQTWLGITEFITVMSKFVVFPIINKMHTLVRRDTRLNAYAWMHACPYDDFTNLMKLCMEHMFWYHQRYLHPLANCMMITAMHLRDLLLLLWGELLVDHASPLGQGWLRNKNNFVDSVHVCITNLKP